MFTNCILQVDSFDFHLMSPFPPNVVQCNRRPPTKLREGNVFTGVCHSVQGVGPHLEYPPLQVTSGDDTHPVTSGDDTHPLCY